VLKFNNNQLVFGAALNGNTTKESLRISFKDIEELTPSDNFVQSEDLSKVQFLLTGSVIPDGRGGNITKLIQTVNLNNGAKFTVINSIYSQATVLNFGGTTVSVPAGGAKQTYIIDGWPFLSSSNSLELHLNISTQGKLVDDSCSKEDLSQLRQGITLTTVNGQIIINMLQIALIDGKFEHVSALLNSTDIILKVPNFKHQMVFDPDFSVLLGGGGGGGGCSGQSDDNLFYASLALIGASFVFVFVFIVTVTIYDHRKKSLKVAKKKKAEAAFQQQQAAAGTS